MKSLFFIKIKQLQLSFCEDTYFEFNILKAFILLLLSLSFYIAFLFSSSFIQSFQITPINLEILSPWLKSIVKENDGIELYVMTAIFPLFLLLSYFISTSKRIKDFSTRKAELFFLYLFLLFFFVTIFESIQWNNVCILIICLSLLLSFLIFKIEVLHFTVWSRFFITILFFIFLIVLGLFINENPSVMDYSFFLGPNNKLLDGQCLGTFFIQYDLLTSLLLLVMQKMHFIVQEMHYVMIILFAFWILLYKKLAVTVFKNKTVIIYFILILILIRGLAIQGGPVSLPQTGPMRLDLWVPLLLIILSYGFETFFTALIFSLAYFLDDVFGFLYLGMYILFILTFFALNYSRKNVIVLIKLSIPIIFVLFIHFIVFKTISSPAGKLYSNFHIGFTPILPNSFFWSIIFVIPICLYLLIQDNKNIRITLFVFGILCIQLIYFFGRSHENNLRNISGIFIFILFFAIDRFYSAITEKKSFHFAFAFFLCLVLISYNKTLRDLRYTIKNKINTGVFCKYNFEKQFQIDADYLKTLKTKKILFISDYDSYLNYRFGYKQIGYYSPFLINLRNDVTVRFLYEKISEGYRLIIYPAVLSPYIKIEDCMIPYNGELNKITKRSKFILVQRNKNLKELLLVERN